MSTIEKDVKNRRACSKKVKKENNTNDQEAEQRFSKQSHVELGLFDYRPTPRRSAMGL